LRAIVSVILLAGMRRGTIQSWLSWLVIACILPAVATTGLVVWQSYARERATIERDTILTARAITQAVDRELAKSIAAAQALATSSSLDVADLDDFYRQAEEVLETLPADNIVLSDASGQQLLNTFRPFGSPLPLHGDLNQVRRVFETGQPAISDLFQGAVLMGPVIAIDVPVSRNGHVIYDLGVGIVPDRLAEILRSQNLPSDWVTAILDSSGTVAARTHAPEEFVGQKAAPALIRRMAEVPEGAINASTLESIPVISSFSRSAISGWSVVIGIPRADLMANLQQTLWLTGAAAALVLLVGGVIARLISRRIGRSIHALTGPALALGAGQSVSAPRTAVVEVNQVAQALVNAAHERARLLHKQEEMAAELRRAQQLEALGHLTGTVAHDFGNLLMPIVGNLELLAKSPADPRTPFRVSSAQAAAERATKLIHSLLAFAHQQPLVVENIDGNLVIHGIAQLLREALGEVGTLSLDLEPGLWPVQADKTQLEMAILNLVVNARDAITTVGEVHVSTANVTLRGEAAGLTGQYVRIAVTDTGAGMPPEVLARAFEPLFTTKPAGKGTGLGLASLYGFAKQCGGAAMIDSAVGRGTTVTVYLPRAQCATDDATVRAAVNS
jgi:signal transduction histidine kinase